MIKITVYQPDSDPGNNKILERVYRTFMENGIIPSRVTLDFITDEDNEETACFATYLISTKYFPTIESKENLEYILRKIRGISFTLSN